MRSDLRKLSTTIALGFRGIPSPRALFAHSSSDQPPEHQGLTVPGSALMRAASELDRRAARREGGHRWRGRVCQLRVASYRHNWYNLGRERSESCPQGPREGSPLARSLLASGGLRRVTRCGRQGSLTLGARRRSSPNPPWALLARSADPARHGATPTRPPCSRDRRRSRHRTRRMERITGAWALHASPTP